MLQNLARDDVFLIVDGGVVRDEGIPPARVAGHKPGIRGTGQIGLDITRDEKYAL